MLVLHFLFNISVANDEESSILESATDVDENQRAYNVGELISFASFDFSHDPFTSNSSQISSNNIVRRFLRFFSSSSRFSFDFSRCSTTKSSIHLIFTVHQQHQRTTINRYSMTIRLVRLLMRLDANSIHHYHCSHLQWHRSCFQRHSHHLLSLNRFQQRKR